MRALITGICGFVGGALARELVRHFDGIEILGLDNLSRPGSQQNRRALLPLGVRFVHGDLRNPSDLEHLPKVDWVIDAAANPSVLAGISGQASSRQLMEHNLVSSLHLVEFCKQHRAGLIMLSTSRVYSLEALAAIPMEVKGNAFAPKLTQVPPSPLGRGAGGEGSVLASSPGLSDLGISEEFPTRPPLSFYGAAKLASEIVMLEYGLAFDFPIHINRCGVLAGAGQFGKADQGIFSFWIHSWRAGRPLKYIGFGGAGHQVRDLFHPRDLSSMVALQMKGSVKTGQVLNLGGGPGNSLSLAQLSAWCAERFGKQPVESDPANRPFDVPWLVLDCSRAIHDYGWKVSMEFEQILDEIARHAEQHPNWLDLSSGT